MSKTHHPAIAFEMRHATEAEQECRRLVRRRLARRAKAAYRDYLVNYGQTLDRATPALRS